MLIQSKSQLAKLLATENIKVEHKAVKTAMFNLETRTLTIPILADDLTVDMYDLFVGHEVGHAIETPAEGWHNGILNPERKLRIPKPILNIVEDARIEKLICRRYPGLKSSFVKAYKELLSRNFFGTKDMDLNGLNYLDRVNLRYKCGVSLGIKFTQEELAINTKIDAMESFEDTLEVSKEILKFMNYKNREAKESITMSEPGITSPLDDEDYGDGWDSDEEGYDDSDEEGSGGKPIEESDDEDGSTSSGDEQHPEEESKKEEDDSTAGSDTANGDMPNQDVIESHTDDAFREREQELMQNGAIDYIYANVPTGINLDQVIVPYKTLISSVTTPTVTAYGNISPSYVQPSDFKYFVEFRNNTSKVVSYLVKEFELRKNADEYKKAKQSNTGELDMTKIFSYKFNEDIFKKITVVPGGKSHGLVIFIDWSGSMADIMQNTIRQLLNLVMFCKKVNIAHEVYAFSTQYVDKNGIPPKNRKYVDYKENDIQFAPTSFALLNLFSNKMSNHEFTLMSTLLLTFGKGRRVYAPAWLQLGGTPLNESIFCAMKIVPQFQKDNKLQIVNTVFLTDGDGHRLTETHKHVQYHQSRLEPTFFQPINGLRRAFLYSKEQNFSVEVINNTAKSFTKACLEVFKRVTGSNVIGFYLIANRRLKNNLLELFPETHRNIIRRDELVQEFQKENSLVCKSAGYDEYYLIKADVVDNADDEIVVKSSATSTTGKVNTRSLVSAFTKYGTNKIKNRVILSKFITLIS
jgi:hypothetical protein